MEKPIVPYYKIAIYREEMSGPFKLHKDFNEQTINEDFSKMLETKFDKAPKKL